MSKARVLMVQGTASSVGKSLIATALCRIFKQDGVRVAPFKAQNMSNNSYATADGLEIGRAQAVQAEAAGVEASVDMNPVLLKPEADDRSQVVVHGRPYGTVKARDYLGPRGSLWDFVRASLDRLRDEYELLVAEGAGSPAEVNLRDREIVNMRVARYCGAAVVLVADIERGGVFASIVGTLELLRPEERSLVRGLIINKFRGDPSLLAPGVEWLEERTGLPVLGVLPYLDDPGIAEEDSLSLERRRALKEKSEFALDVAVIGLPHISNFDDFDSLERASGVRLRYVEAADLLGDPDLVVLPGTKATIADLDWLRRTGNASAVTALAVSGTPVIGVCGGYQMLGESIADPECVESDGTSVAGLGLLPVRTTFLRRKSTHRVRAVVSAVGGMLGGAAGIELDGYEIHMGHTERNSGTPAFRLTRIGNGEAFEDGCLSGDRAILGTYVHGLFDSDALREALLGFLARRKGIVLPGQIARPARDVRYDRLADFVRGHVDIGRLREFSGLPTPS